MKTMRTTGIFIAAALLSIKVMAQQTQELVVPLSDPGKPYKLEAGLVTGSIKIIGYEGKDVVINAEGDERKHEDRGERDGMHRVVGGTSLDITAKERNNSVSIDAGIPNKTVNLTIKVPQNGATLKLSTVNGKCITVSNVSGDMEINCTNGYITMDNISGSVVASSINGNVKVGFKTIDPKAPMAFSTLNGNVDVTFPASLKASFKLKSDRGEIYTDFDLITDKSTPKVNKSVKEGMYRLTMDEWVTGKVDGGGPEMMMKTMNGNIYIKKAKENTSKTCFQFPPRGGLWQTV
jgi:DUF4097 and DUF4098 domain-containing protein YvlB